MSSQGRYSISKAALSAYIIRKIALPAALLAVLVGILIRK